MFDRVPSGAQRQIENIRIASNKVQFGVYKWAKVSLQSQLEGPHSPAVFSATQ